jgi:hypothetical protein
LSLPTPQQAPTGRRRALLIGAALLVIVAIGGGVALLASGILRPVPTTASLDPPDGQKEVGVSQPLRLTFSRPVGLTAVETSLRIEPTLDGALAASPDRRHLTWTPGGPWGDLTTYTVTLMPLKDSAGNKIPTHRWHFTTTIVPRVVGLLTDAGTATTDGSELPLGSGLTIGFNTPMAPATVSVLLNSTAAALNWSGDGKEASFSTKGIPAGALAVALAPGAQDRLQHALPAEWKLGLNLVYTLTEHTVPLQSPAIVQIPNDNYGARDQSGLQAASMVFEYLTEGNITRLSAVFTSVPDVVGPIRSGRLISFKITRHYHGVNYFSGLSSGSFGVLTHDGVPTLFDTQGVYYRSPDRVAPNNLYIKGDSIKAYEDRAVPAFALQSGTSQALSGPDAPTVSVPEHVSTYTYDPATATYLKAEGGRPMNDALINQALHIQLLVVMHARETITGIVEDVGGAHGRDFDMESGGAAEFYFRGNMQSGHWSAPDRRSPFTFQLDDGRILTMPRNLVWVDVVGG